MFVAGKPRTSLPSLWASSKASRKMFIPSSTNSTLQGVKKGRI